MSKRDNYVKELAKTNFVTGLTTSMVGNELCAKALLRILLDKKIITYEEWVNAIKLETEAFVSTHTHHFEDLSEPDFIDFIQPEEKTHK